MVLKMLLSNHYRWAHIYRTLEGSRAGEQFISGSGEYLQVESDVLIESVGFKFLPLEDGLCGPLFAPGGKLESRNGNSTSFFTPTLPPLPLPLPPPPFFYGIQKY